MSQPLDEDCVVLKGGHTCGRTAVRVLRPPGEPAKNADGDLYVAYVCPRHGKDLAALGWVDARSTGETS